VVVVTGDVFSLPTLGQVAVEVWGDGRRGKDWRWIGASKRNRSGRRPTVAGETAAEGLRYSNWRVATDQSLVTVGYRLPAMVPEGAGEGSS
jgi:hypothetical protein